MKDYLILTNEEINYETGYKSTSVIFCETDKVSTNCTKLTKVTDSDGNIFEYREKLNIQNNDLETKSTKELSEKNSSFFELGDAGKIGLDTYKETLDSYIDRLPDASKFDKDILRATGGVNKLPMLIDAMKAVNSDNPIKELAKVGVSETFSWTGAAIGGRIGTAAGIPFGPQVSMITGIIGAVGGGFGGGKYGDYLVSNDTLDLLSYFFNPFDSRWQGKDSDWLEDIKDFWKNFFNPIADVTIYDPITLDLNNDGKISTLNLGDGVYFDHNGDKIAFKTSWIGKEDGILVFDKNNNGLIDNGNELFGNFTEISNSQTLNNPNNQISNSQISNNPSHNTPLNQNNQNKQTSNSDSLNSQTSILNSQTKFAINGYHALAMQDSNGDGKIDTFDEIFSNLKIWQDLNEDGISQANELKTLDEHGIKSISLNFNKPKNSDILKDSSDIFKRQKFIQNLKKLTTSNQIVTKKIYNFKSYEFVA